MTGTIASKKSRGKIGSGRYGMKRRNFKTYDGSSALNRPSIRRLARRAGVKRLSGGIYDEVPTAIRAWLTKIIRDIVTYAEYSQRKTVIINDVLLSLKRHGQVLYGFEMREKADRKRRLLEPLKESNLTAAAVEVGQLEVDHDESTPKSSKKETSQSQKRVQQTLSAQKPTVDGKRALEIQMAIGAYFDTVLRTQGRSDADVDHVTLWTGAYLQGKGIASCTKKDVSVVLRAMEREDKVTLTDSNKRVWLCF